MTQSVIIKTNYSLRALNSFSIDVSANYFASFNSLEQLLYLLRQKQAQERPLFVLGGGCNILLTQNYPGLVLQNNIPGIQKVKEDKDFIWLKVGAGESWHQLVCYCVDKNYGGIENLSLIPGKVGAAPIQNIGAYGVELKNTLVSLEGLNRQTGKVEVINKSECEFGYRDSIFKHKAKDSYVILSVTLRLSKKPVVDSSYGAIQAVLQEMAVSNPSIKDVSQAVIKIRQRKLPDPVAIPNAGSFFKNPVVDRKVFNELAQQFPEMPCYNVSADRIKIPAAWLIEQCQWKGKRLGNVGVHSQQALVLINCGHASGAELVELSYQIQKSVKEKFQIELEPEVRII